MPTPAFAAPEHPLTPLLRKLGSLTRLSARDKAAVLRLPVHPRVFTAGQDLVSEGDRPTQCWLIVEGWVQRYKILTGGRRQISAFHVAGDMADLPSLHLPVMDHSLGAVTNVAAVAIPHEALRKLLERHPHFNAPFWRDTLVDAAIFREWVANVGRRPAYQRLAHLFCELYLKQASVGLAHDHRCPMPMTQVDLADASGLTSVHINRTLRDLRRDRLIDLKSKLLVIHDWTRLVEAAEFDSTYLQLDRPLAA
ncbi:Crp/Fnr family transcriptional regulator [Methylobacterium radiotolerans]|uniref:Crp/Fnr family transcriptional regulator n=1 Tax=Methylobacterium radiotolerans TaxID=31998 RepID=UPI0038D07437